MDTDTVSAPVFRYAAITFDCPDPAALARFYGDLLDLPVAFSSDHFVFLGREGEAGLGFSLLADYRPPSWPDPAREKRAHIELGVDDLEAAQAHVLDRGASAPATQPDPGRWRVLLDPAGHPFCISTLV
ncbi:VOC family protein [Streptomonospora wellingtoniae]|uniref:VOC family protein n=1 Tax=Streptomonospora wellingtoniae TaxID=3075544 RepID=A0ABU2L084_9ACTN|nr:VOC family protein [Streptomonospora sp. DSM 45055]MDT0304964.1 VOC family protein [Streptomonospora sp. DSM 45055]